MSNKHPILGRGEVYVSNIEKRYYGGPRKMPHTYHENKEILINCISSIQEEIKRSNEIFLSDKVICVRMEPKFEAKSYSPDALLSINGISPLGGRKYTISQSDEGSVKSKLYFAKTNNEGLEKLKNVLTSGEKDNMVTWQNQICSIRTIDLLLPDEKIAGFPVTWNSGLVEIVLHPFVWNDEFAMKQFLDLLDLEENKYRIVGYNNGPVFCAAECSKEVIQRMARFNPLRTIHPLGEINIPNMRGGSFFDAPLPPVYKGKPQVTVGVFDGGANTTLPHLKDYVQGQDLTTVPEYPALMNHGTGVCGAVLYGALNYKKPSDVLDTPMVNVKSFRILPQNQTGNPIEDSGLYPAIDEIEKVVPSHPEIKLYNLSFGPRGAIVDDDISRFTYALDMLSLLPHHPLFCVAVGNDGDLPYPFNRVQAPADLVNGLGIGAYTYDRNGEKVRATYSCVGPGREGCKIKPDVVEFGGSLETQVVLISTTENKTTTSCGTSFASPIATGKLGRMLALAPEISPQMARTLLIHTAKGVEETGIEEIGYGFCEDDISNILNCEDNKVLVLYEGSILPKQNIKLPILLPDLSGTKSTVRITWTILTLSEVNPQDVDSYTCNGIEDYFYPHESHFSYTKNTLEGKIQKTAFASTEQEQELFENGFSRSDLPVCKPPKQYLSEEELRVQHLKWDTVVKKTITMRTSSLYNPFFILHGMNRDAEGTKAMRYYTAITVEIPKYKGILYDDVITQYRSLLPINLRLENQLYLKNE